MIRPRASSYASSVHAAIIVRRFVQFFALAATTTRVFLISFGTPTLPPPPTTESVGVFFPRPFFVGVEAVVFEGGCDSTTEWCSCSTLGEDVFFRGVLGEEADRRNYFCAVEDEEKVLQLQLPVGLVPQPGEVPSFELLCKGSLSYVKFSYDDSVRNNTNGTAWYTPNANAVSAPSFEDFDTLSFSVQVGTEQRFLTGNIYIEPRNDKPEWPSSAEDPLQFEPYVDFKVRPNKDANFNANTSYDKKWEKFDQISKETPSKFTVGSEDRYGVKALKAYFDCAEGWNRDDDGTIVVNPTSGDIDGCNRLSLSEANPIDGDGDFLRYEVITQPEKGLLKLECDYTTASAEACGNTASKFTYVPYGDVTSGWDEFTYRVHDGEGGGHAGINPPTNLSQTGHIPGRPLNSTTRTIKISIGERSFIPTIDGLMPTIGGTVALKTVMVVEDKSKKFTVERQLQSSVGTIENNNFTFRNYRIYLDESSLAVPKSTVAGTDKVLKGKIQWECYDDQCEASKYGGSCAQEVSDERLTDGSGRYSCDCKPNITDTTLPRFWQTCNKTDDSTEVDTDGSLKFKARFTYIPDSNLGGVQEDPGFVIGVLNTDPPRITGPFQQNPKAITIQIAEDDDVTKLKVCQLGPGNNPACSPLSTNNNTIENTPMIRDTSPYPGEPQEWKKFRIQAQDSDATELFLNFANYDTVYGNVTHIFGQTPSMGHAEGSNLLPADRDTADPETFTWNLMFRAGTHKRFPSTKPQELIFQVAENKTFFSNYDLYKSKIANVSVSFVTACAEGYFVKQRSMNNCDPCNEGTYSVGLDSEICSRCSEGSYANVKGVSACSLCEDTGFQPNIGGVICDACPENSKTFAPGAVAESQCLCQAGYFGDVTNPGLWPNWPLQRGQYTTPCYVCASLIGSNCSKVGMPIPEALPGYYIDLPEWWPNFAACNAKFEQNANSTERNVNCKLDQLTIRSCDPEDACPGNVAFEQIFEDTENQCSRGYEGKGCAKCSKNFYKFNTACDECFPLNYKSPDHASGEMLPITEGLWKQNSFNLTQEVMDEENTKIQRINFALTNAEAPNASSAIYFVLDKGSRSKLNPDYLKWHSDLTAASSPVLFSLNVSSTPTSTVRVNPTPDEETTVYVWDTDGKTLLAAFNMTYVNSVGEKRPILDINDDLWQAYLMGALFLIGFIAFLPILVKLLRRFKAISILFVFIQITSVMLDLDFNWPPIMANIFKYFAIFTFDIELLQPECYVTAFKWGFFVKYGIVVLSPLIFGATFVLLAISKFLVGHILIKMLLAGTFDSWLDYDTRGIDDHGNQRSKMYRMKERVKKMLADKKETLSEFSVKEQFLDVWQMFVRIMLTLMDVSYIFLARETFSFFDCVKNENGNSYLESDQGVQCATSLEELKNPVEAQEMWVKAFPFALILLILYPFGIIVTLYLTLYKIRHKLNRPDTVKTFGFLYVGYRPAWYRYKILVLLRQLGVVMSTKFFSKDTVISRLGQSMGCLTTLFVAMTIHFFADPQESKRLDRLESAALFICFIYIFSGLIFLTEEASQDFDDFLTTFNCALILGLCFVFLIYISFEVFPWMYKTAKSSKGLAGVVFGDVKEYNDDKKTTKEKLALYTAEKQNELDRRLTKKMTLEQEKEQSISKGPALYRRMTMGSKRNIKTAEELRSESRSQFVSKQVKNISKEILTKKHRDFLLQLPVEEEEVKKNRTDFVNPETRDSEFAELTDEGVDVQANWIIEKFLPPPFTRVRAVDILKRVNDLCERARQRQKIMRGVNTTGSLKPAGLFSLVRRYTLHKVGENLIRVRLEGDDNPNMVVSKIVPFATDKVKSKGSWVFSFFGWVAKRLGFNVVEEASDKKRRLQGAMKAAAMKQAKAQQAGNIMAKLGKRTSEAEKTAEGKKLTLAERVRQQQQKEEAAKKKSETKEKTKPTPAKDDGEKKTEEESKVKKAPTMLERLRSLGSAAAAAKEEEGQKGEEAKKGEEKKDEKDEEK